MPSVSHIAHAGLAFANPMSEAVVDTAIAALPVPAQSRILETGCGRGEILLRTVRMHAGSRGLGLDVDKDAIDEAEARATGMPVDFEIRDAADITDKFDAVLNVAASHAHEGFPAVLPALRRLAPVALYGEGFWQREPSEDFLDALGGATADELASLDGLRSAIADAGFDIVGEWLASSADWASYEERLAANAERHGTPGGIAYAQRIRNRRALPDGTDTLGFALFVLRA